MTNSYSLIDCEVKAFYDVLRDLSGIAPIYSKIHNLLCTMQHNLSDSAQKVLYIYFSLLDDGNTRIALDPAKALAKWMNKWNSLIKLAVSDSSKKMNPLADTAHADESFSHILTQGIADILTQSYTNIIEFRKTDVQTEPGTATKPLVIHESAQGIKYLYATRYFDAKCIIESRARTLFTYHPNAITDAQRKKCQQFFDPLLNSQFKLANCQLDAIIRGQSENLIITGGPGTGKTTVICFLLWKLLHDNKDMQNWSIKLAAPSGKAADRMRESLLKSLSKFKDTTCKIYQTLHQLESYTLHRLLSYNPRKNQFNYDAENRFPEKTLFIIDEASMIDIDLFAKLLQALPEKNFRLFILGDPDQLPSVEAGAVLGEMLKTGDVAVKLDESKRFNRDSKIGRLSLSIQEAKNAVENGWSDKYEKPVFESLSNISFSLQDDDRLRFISLHEDKKEEEKDIEKLIKAWTDAFYIAPKYLEQVSKIQVNHNNELIDVETQQPCDPQRLDELWQFTESARILSAERKGTRGIQSLNACVRKALDILSNDPFYVGQFLMITENQSTLKLYNGDCGIVLGEPNSGRLHLLLKKVRTQNKANSNEVVSDYVTYPLSLLPPDALESAFAITIHKSQGSGYGNIMMFLPQTVGHPLLNNQMIYTGVTRTEKKSLTIVASQAAFEAGCQTSIERDTGIDIGI